MIKFLDNTPNQTTKFRRKKWVEINDDICGTYNTNSQIKLKISVLRSSLCDYSDAQMMTYAERITLIIKSHLNFNVKIKFM